MASAAPTVTGTKSSQHALIQSEDWPQDIHHSHCRHGEWKQFTGDGLNTGVQVLSDGRLDININEHRPSIAGLLNRIQSRTAPSDLKDLKGKKPPEAIPKDEGKEFPLKMNIVIQVIGSRGDIQPFVALGKELKAHGHRVRLATHLAFREFVLDGGLEFFCIGGDPEELMAFMVQNPSLLPAFSTIRSGAIQKRRREMKEIIYGCWKSCIETGDGTNLHQIKEDLWSDTMDYRRRPFVADAIIANPPGLAHIHCAQRLGIPLHMMFTMPWSPTQSFPHPLAVIHQSGCKPTVANFVSYAIVDMMIWEGSPGLLPKPVDWSDNIDICGFSVLPAKSDYTPPKEIVDFLEAGPRPIYVGFGSIVVDDPINLTQIVFEAIKSSGQRAIVSKGWGNLGADRVDVPDNILIVGNVPHDWLFQNVSCVVHHGGAGTTAAGLSLGRPTIIIPFFGDQQFWGGIVAMAGAGPAPVPYKQLTAASLTDAIEIALEPSTQEKAQEIADKMQEESGVRDGVRSFHRQLDLKALQCAICPDRPAVWHVKQTSIALSAFAAAVLVETGRLKPENVVLNRPSEYDTYRDPVGPISASAQVLLGAIAHFITGIGELPYEMASDISTDDEISIDGIDDEVNDNLPTNHPDQRQSLELELTRTMSSVIPPERKGVGYEIRTHGSRMSKKLLKTIIWLPTDLTLSLSKGFHNAPKLYHDRTVKATPKVSGFRSGLTAARTELRDGFCYGIKGVVTQPRTGFQEEGAKGMAKGMVKGVSGLFFKPPAGLWGLAGYPLVGLRRELQISLGKNVDGDIITSRIDQGRQEMQEATADERAEVARKWALIQEDFRVSY
ncbi:hypothetical protein N7457_006379 [Penicillium paradoxum]|uniref:uncharacterized protein n=1 Tax=Penicillium paradoxum TaxID=176176 RepID=UPI0025481E22|nr:uncharacterized protein N7457_006379 [Penicillium paradoxum]KAJ5781219.1 hypothetical protein N7457_006379 [Penicillium paradoxum]